MSSKNLKRQNFPAASKSPRGLGVRQSAAAFQRISGPKDLRCIVRDLLSWFSQNARPLPWRQTRDPYAVWVSEIMLQQTQVKTVIPYWERWMRALPTIADLANAAPETIHKLWEGLGYYTRVRNMQRAAQEIMARHDGKFPRDYGEILGLPGIGRYTAGAISSIAFNEPRPILDGNVIRVLTRIFGITENPKDKSTNERLWNLAQQLVTTAHAQSALPNPEHGTRNSEPQRRNSELNQSLMELGALICTPKQPRCLVCPLQNLCNAHKTQRSHLIPNLGPRVAATERRFAAFVLEHRGKYLVRQRPAGQVNAHLWEFPNFEVTSDNPDLIQLARKHFGPHLSSTTEFCTIRHTITRYRITLLAFEATLPGKLKIKRQKSKMRWLSLSELDSLAFTSAHRKILRCLLNPK